MSFRKWSAFLLPLLWALTAAAEERVALVIGNGAYEGAVALKNPAHDAEIVAAALSNLDFKVTKAIDVDLPQLEDAVVKFSRALKKDSVAFFFYAGHGVQVKGENFLVPLKANPQEEFQVKQKCYKVDHVLDAMDSSSAALKVVILDCCRDNPFTRSWTRGTANQGLASIKQIPDGTIIAFSTAPGQTALDGKGANSPYATHLAKNLQSRPSGGLEVTQMLRATAQSVYQDVAQRPWINFDASTADYYLWKGGGGNSVETNTPAKTTGPISSNKKSPVNLKIQGDKLVRLDADAREVWINKLPFAGPENRFFISPDDELVIVAGPNGFSAFSVQTGKPYWRSDRFGFSPGDIERSDFDLKLGQASFSLKDGRVLSVDLKTGR